MANNKKKHTDLLSDLKHDDLTTENLDKALERLKQRARLRAARMNPHTDNTKQSFTRTLGTIMALGLTLTFCTAVLNSELDDNKTAPDKTNNTTQTVEKKPQTEEDTSIWDDDGGTLVPGTPGIVPGVSLF